MSQQAQRRSGDQALQAAVQMEQIGKDFYDALAGASADPQVRELSHKLAVEEANHARIFERIRSDLARKGQTVLLGDEQVAQARQTLMREVLPDAEAIRHVAEKGNAHEMLAMAIQMEKDAIRFYGALPRPLAETAEVKAVIREEQTHLRLLSALRDLGVTGP
jgi:rubrerythrin